MKTEKRKVTLYIHASKYVNSDYEICVSTYKQKSCEYFTVIDIATVDVEINIPTINKNELIQANIEQLKNRIEKERADSFLRVQAVKDEIQKMLCLENNT